MSAILQKFLAHENESPSWMDDRRRNTWNHVTRELHCRGLLEENWRPPRFSPTDGDQIWNKFEEDLWEAVVALRFGLAGVDVQRAGVQISNVDFRLHSKSQTVFAECVSPNLGDVSSAAAPYHAKDSDFKKQTLRASTGESFTVESAEQYDCGEADVADSANRRQLRYASAITAKADGQLTACGTMMGSAPRILIINSSNLRHRHISRPPCPTMPTVVASDCVNAVFGGSGIAAFALDSKTNTASGGLHLFSKEIKKPGTEALVEREGFLNDSLASVSAILHNTRQPHCLAELFFTDRKTFIDEFDSQSELILNPSAKYPLPLHHFIPRQVTVSFDSDRLHYDFSRVAL